MEHRVLVGIDCGQSHLSISVVTADGEIKSHGVGGPSHIQGADMAETFRHAFEEAMASISPDAIASVDAVGVGVTGIGIPGKREAILSVLADVFPGIQAFLTNDAVTAHWGATRGADGATILAGTGTIAYGSCHGTVQRLGGFGYLLGDEGGGSWIGLNALRRALRASEGRDRITSLSETIPAYFGLDHIRKVSGHIQASRNVDVQGIAGLCRLVATEADCGDRVAGEVLSEAARELSKLTNHLLGQIDASTEPMFPVYRLGGVWQAGRTLNEPFEQEVIAEFPNVVWADPHGDAAYGAAIYAQACLNGIEIGG